MVRVCGWTDALPPVQYRNVGHAHGVVGNSGPGEIPVLAGTRLKLQALGPVFGASEKSGAIGPDHELVRMIGINRLGQKAVVKVYVAAAVVCVAHQYGHAGGMGLHGDIECGEQPPVGDDHADHHQASGEDRLGEQYGSDQPPLDGVALHVGSGINPAACSPGRAGCGSAGATSLHSVCAAARRYRLRSRC